MIFSVEGERAVAVRAGVQAAQPAGDGLLRPGVQRPQGRHGEIFVGYNIVYDY